MKGAKQHFERMLKALKSFESLVEPDTGRYISWIGGCQICGGPHVRTDLTSNASTLAERR